MIIRKFRKRDAEAVSRLIIENLESFSNEYYSTDAIAMLKRRNSSARICKRAETSITIVAVNGKKIIGTASLKNDQILNVFVRLDFHGMGVGRKLVTELEKVAKMNVERELFVYACVQAVGFYEKIGFKSFGKIMQSLGNTKIEVVNMRKTFGD